MYGWRRRREGRDRRGAAFTPYYKNDEEGDVTFCTRSSRAVSMLHRSSKADAASATSLALPSSASRCAACVRQAGGHASHKLQWSSAAQINGIGVPCQSQLTILSDLSAVTTSTVPAYGQLNLFRCPDLLSYFTAYPRSWTHFSPVSLPLLRPHAFLQLPPPSVSFPSLKRPSAKRVLTWAALSAAPSSAALAARTASPNISICPSRLERQATELLADVFILSMASLSCKASACAAFAAESLQKASGRRVERWDTRRMEEGGWLSSPKEEVTGYSSRQG